MSKTANKYAPEVREADYGALDERAVHRIKLELIAAHRDVLLRQWPSC